MSEIKVIRWGRIWIGLGLIAAGFGWIYINSLLGVGSSSKQTGTSSVVSYPHSGVQVAGSVRVGIDWLTSTAQLRQHPAVIDVVVGVHNQGTQPVTISPSEFALIPIRGAKIVAQNTVKGGLPVTTLVAHGDVRGLLRFPISRDLTLAGTLLRATISITNAHNTGGGSAKAKTATLTWSVL